MFDEQSGKSNAMKMYLRLLQAITKNVDHNLTSATAQTSFHGTTVSTFLYPSTSSLSVTFRLNAKDADIPEFFTDIKTNNSDKS